MSPRGLSIALFTLFTLTAVAVVVHSAPSPGAFFVPGQSSLELFPVVSAAPRDMVTASLNVDPASDDGNGQIDGGETVVFHYTLYNRGNTAYEGLQLVTGVDRTKIHTIHEVLGGSGYFDDDGTVTLPNIVLLPHQELSLGFKARANYGTDEDVLATTPELRMIDNQLLGTAPRFEQIVESRQLPAGRSRVQSREKEGGR